MTPESEPAAPQPASHHMADALSSVRDHLRKYALRLLFFAVLAFLLFRLVPSLAQALDSLERVSWLWLLAALALETLSEIGYVVAWRQIVDPERVLEQEGGGRRLDVRLAWAQLGGGLLVPAGSFSGVGAGAVLLRRRGLPLQTVTEREFNLSFLNTAIDALALISVGVLLALGVFAGKNSLTLTILPAAVAAAALVAAILIARRADHFAARLEPRHPRIAAGIGTVARAVEETNALVFGRGDWRSVFGALAYLFFDVLVLWTAFFALHAHSVPAFAPVLMAYVIGALGGSLPLPAGLGAVGGIGGCLILYGAGRNVAVGAAVIYGAIGLVVPFVGGLIAYLLLTRQLRRQRRDAVGEHGNIEVADGGMLRRTVADTDELPHDRWRAYFDDLSRGLVTTQATVEIDGPDLGAQVQAEGLVLSGISYDDRDDVLVIGLSPGGAAESLEHLVSSPQRISVEPSDATVPSTIEVEDAEGEKTLVRLQAAPTLPAE